MIEMAEAKTETKNENVIERRCPRCSWFLWELHGVEGTGQQVLSIRSLCPNRKCKRRDTFKVESMGVK